jgi:hypothetical protein
MQFTRKPFNIFEKCELSLARLVADMSRIRAIKPQFFRHSELFDAEKETGLPLRLAYAGLWTVADREGRFKWKPREIKVEVLPYDDVDFAAVLDALARYRFVIKYQCNGEWFGYIPKFKEHQHINKHEPESSIPEPPKEGAPKVRARAKQVRAPREGNDVGNDVGKGREGNDVSAEPQAAHAPAVQPIVSLPTNLQGEEVPIFRASADEWAKTYPAVDVLQELREMRAWLIANPEKRKTARGMAKFVNRWLSKEQDKGNGRGQTGGRERAPSRVDNAFRGARRFLETAGGVAEGEAAAGTGTAAIAGPVHAEAGESHDHPRANGAAAPGPRRDLSVAASFARSDDAEIPDFLRRPARTVGR